MALARFALNNLPRRVASTSSSFLFQNVSERTPNAAQRQRLGSELLRRLSSVPGEQKPESGDVAVSEGSKKSKLFPKRRRRGSLWRRRDTDFPPSLWEFFPSGLGKALLEASQNINKLFEQLSPSQLMGGKVKEHDECYKLRFNLPGLGKDDVKITVEDGILMIKGEHKEEEGDEEGNEDEHWYGYNNTSVMLPEDAKVDEIKAQMKDGVLTITIPRTEKPKKDVKEIPVL